MMYSILDKPRDCKDIHTKGDTKSGIYVIFPFQPNITAYPVLCDMDNNGGGFTVINYLNFVFNIPSLVLIL